MNIDYSMNDVSAKIVADSIKGCDVVTDFIRRTRWPVSRTGVGLYPELKWA